VCEAWPRTVVVGPSPPRGGELSLATTACGVATRCCRSHRHVQPYNDGRGELKPLVEALMILGPSRPRWAFSGLGFFVARLQEGVRAPSYQWLGTMVAPTTSQASSAAGSPWLLSQQSDLDDLYCQCPAGARRGGPLCAA
jgi:hypothetical protein